MRVVVSCAIAFQSKDLDAVAAEASVVLERAGDTAVLATAQGQQNEEGDSEALT